MAIGFFSNKSKCEPMTQMMARFGVDGFADEVISENSHRERKRENIRDEDGEGKYSKDMENTKSLETQKHTGSLRDGCACGYGKRGLRRFH